MKTIEYLSDPAVRGVFLPALIAALAVAVQCGALSVFVVVRRLAFVGHGVSHAAFGGVGVAAALGLAAAGAGATERGLALMVVAAFCIAAAVLVGAVTARSVREGGTRTGTLREDTVIGMVLVGAMALGAILLHAATRAGRVGSGAFVDTLFGSILAVRGVDALAAWAVGAMVLAVLWWRRRALVLWAFDEGGARAMGVATAASRILLLGLLGASVVVSMRLAGVVLVTALLVIPGAVALRLSDRLERVFVLSVGASVLGVLGGVVLSFEADWPPGPSVVAVLLAMLGGAVVWSAGESRLRRAERIGRAG